jgi:hypothetical protein
MCRPKYLALSLLPGLFLSDISLAQRGFSGSGRASAGGVNVSGEFGADRDGDGRRDEPTFDPATEMPGTWRIEILVDEDSTDPEARGDIQVVLAEVTMLENQVIGRIDDRGIQGEFTCTISPAGHCERGRLRFATDPVDWEEFYFELIKPDFRRGDGWGIFVDEAAGVRREYELLLEKFRAPGRNGTPETSP